MDSLSGAVERITFYNAENGYTVLRLRPESGRGAQAVNASSLSRDGLITVVGNLPELFPGEHLHLEGHWDKHPKHGSQFKAEVFEQTLTADFDGRPGTYDWSDADQLTLALWFLCIKLRARNSPWS